MDKDTMKVIAIYVVLIVGWNLFCNWVENKMRNKMYKDFSFRYGRYSRTRSSNNSNGMNWKKAAKAFGTSIDKLKKMSKDEIKKTYRKRAKAAHPDKGGSEKAFQNLHNAYEFAAA